MKNNEVINKKRILLAMQNLKDPQSHGKAFGYTLGTGLAGLTAGALIGDVVGSPWTGAGIGISAGAATGAVQARKYYIEKNSKPSFI